MLKSLSDSTRVPLSIYSFSPPPWNQARLEHFINPPVEESLSLEYKAAGALLNLDDAKKAEITKDVSAFANSSGGTLIYGIAEFPKPKRHWPERLDPIDRNQVSKERLEQIIQSIQPRVVGVTIHPVEIESSQNLVCYVVEIPASQTAHQARDHVYYKRQNFNVLPMEDYEIRDVMNRRSHPEVRAALWFKMDANSDAGVFLVKVENVSAILARHVMVRVKLPVFMKRWFGFKHQDSYHYPINEESTGFAWSLKAIVGRATPLFPDDMRIIDFPVVSLAKPSIDARKGGVLKSAEAVEVEIFADSSRAVKVTLPISDVVSGWTSCHENAPKGL